MSKKKPEELGFEAMPAEERGVRARFSRFEKATAMHAHNFIVRRIHNLIQVRRTALAWAAMAFLLVVVGWFQLGAQRPLFSHIGGTEGGAYIEGVVGEVEALNPIFATNAAERGASELLFAGLLRIDEKGGINTDLAESWQVTDEGRVYTLKLRPNLKWSDGAALTSEDVAFTINAIQTPVTRSPLAVAWRNIRVEAKDPRTVVFTLRAPYAPFLHTLTVGILPRHALSNIDLTQLRNAAFNKSPTVTSGPFLFRAMAGERAGSRSVADVYLTRNDAYHLGKTKLERYSMRVYKDSDSLVAAMREREIMAATDIPFTDVNQFIGDRGLKVTQMRPFSGVYAFFKTSVPPLDDLQVRRALIIATNKQEIAEKAGNAEVLQGPLLPGQLGYDAVIQQPAQNIEEAGKLLDVAGWPRDANGKRVKDGQPLTVRLVSLNSGDFGSASQLLQQQWAKLGVTIDLQLVQPEDFQANVITPHAYDVLVYELALGRDSDLYAFWHSSQAALGRLNLSEYRSPAVDDALDSGRSLLDVPLRAVKYRTFSEQWVADAPAVALYRPSLYYVQLAKSFSVREGELGDVLERLSNIQYWTAETARLDDTR